VERREELQPADVPAFALPHSGVRAEGHSPNPDHCEDSASVMTDMDDIFVAIRTYIEGNYDKQIKLTTFSAATGISQRDAQNALSYFARSWGRMLLDERMKRAKELLSYSGESIEVIGSRVGYDDTSQFIRTFKADEGKEPEEYRQWIQKQQQQAASPLDGSPSS
jgi:two-component system response regulator YesN